MLGMTAGGVRAYRQRHNIPAGWRADGKVPASKPARRTSSKTRTRVVTQASARAVRRPVAPAPVVTRPRRKPSRKNIGPAQMAYTVNARGHSGSLTAVAMAASPWKPQPLRSSTSRPAIPG